MESAAISGAQWVVGKALSPLSDGLVEAWAASSELGPNIEALKMELLYAQAMLNNARGREIRNPALAELLQRLRGLAYGAEDVLDELDYFRIQDELDGTFEAADVDGRGCVRNLVRDGRHTAKAAAKQLGCASCFSAGDTHGPEGSCKCVRRLSSRARTIAHSVGKRLLCASLLSVGNDQGDDSKHAPRAPKLKFDRVDVSRRMKYIVEQLQPVSAKVSTILDLELLGAIAKLDKLGSSRNIGNVESTGRSITTSEALEPTLYGRDREKNSIVEDITKGAYIHRDLTVVPIVGPGGIGKTTLTQHIYNSQEVQDHFQIRVWVCVSLDFNVYRLTQEIVRSLPRAEDEKNEKANGEPQNLDQLQKLVEKRLKNRRFLLVLDDIWNHGNDEWKRFLVPFRKEQGRGNIVLVTTRFLEVAEMVRKGDKLLQVEGLEPREYWSLFLACVFDDTNQQYKDKTLLAIGEKIVEKLKGSPLAAKTVGRLLRDNLNVDHWIRVLESKEWESRTGDDDIMPALKLSYDYLPFYLQQCFSYCALFPEDYRFDREELIRFWIGLDILRPGQRAKRIEDTGLDYLNELVNYGFFKKETEDSGARYVMHDLLHDLALKVSSQECLHIASSSTRPVEISPCIYHLSISTSPANSEDGMIEENFRKELRKISSRLKSENLHTLMLFGKYDESLLDIFSDLFKDAKSLRVIRLPAMSYTVESILHNFSKLVHLRYLQVELQVYKIDEHLATSLSRFYHLRVLDLRSYPSDLSLLRDMTNLVKLRHFLVWHEKFHSNISNVGKLHSLQELTRFEVRKENNGFELRELGELEEAGGSLVIYNLENVQVNEAHEAKLLYKNRLEKLTLNWLNDRSNKNADTEDQVLERLRPHSNLHDLCISGHGGFTCPTWLGTNLSIKGLEALRLDGVAWKVLPPLGEMWLIISESDDEKYYGYTMGPNFHNLKRLELVGLTRFKRWVANEVCPRFFSLIEVLVVADCPELTELPFSSYTCYPPERDANVTWFPRLRESEIQDCPKLLSLPPVPYSHTLSSVEVSCVRRGLKRLSYSNYDSFISLEIEGNNALHNLDDTVLVFDNLTQLKSLKLIKCPPLAEEHLQMLTSLETLEMDGCSSNLFLPSPQSDVRWQIPVNNLRIKSCGASGKELTQLLSHLPKLSELTLEKCEMITRLGVEAEQQQTTRPILLPSSSVVKLQETHAAGEQQQEEVSPTEEEAGGLLLLPAHLSDSLQELWIEECPELGGSLDICNLENVQVNEAHEAKLLYKIRLEKLTLIWPDDRSNKNPDIEDQVLESLRPHSNLHDLCIYRHGGFTCPTWLGTNLSIKGLEALRLQMVDWKFLPPLGEMWLIGGSGEEYFGCITGLNFHNLKRLELVGLPRFKRWVANEVCPRFFSLIEELVVVDCPELSELPFSSYTCYPPERDANVTWFPRLRGSEIHTCPKLLSLPPVPYSQTLSFVDISCVRRGLERLGYSNSESVISLEIEGNNALHNLDNTVLVFDNLTQLESLKLIKCPPLAVEHFQMLTSLKTLNIHGCSSNLFLTSPQSDLKWQIAVNNLEIVSCGASGKELTQQLSHLPKLSKLTLKNCEMITRLGVEAEQQQTTRPILLPSSSVVKLQDTHAAGQRRRQEVSPTEEVVVEQEEVGGLLLLPAHLSETLHRLWIDGCPELILAAQTRDTGGEGLQAMGSLKKIRIEDCPKFLSAYQTSCSSFPFPSSLQHLYLEGSMEGGMDTLAPLSNLTSLKDLFLQNSGEDLRCEGLWPLLTRGQISELEIHGSPKFFVGWNPTQELLDEQAQRICKPLELRTEDIAGVLAAPICRLLSSSLTKLFFSSNLVERFTKEQEEALPLLTSLQELEFFEYRKLQRLPAGLNKLTNLKRLQICGCPAIRSLPKDGLPSSLQELDVRGCGNAKLKQRCRRLKGTIPKIIL